MMRRREFFESAFVAAVCLFCAPRLGQVRFCRVSHKRWLGMVRRGSIVEVDPTVEGATFLGSKATLIVNRGNWRLFPGSEA